MKKVFHHNYSVRLILFLVLIVLSIYSLTIGVKDYSLTGLLQGNEADVFLTLISRLPRLMSCLIAGASLSIAGLIMQTITNNKFVSPSTAGTMEWCKLGIMLAILFAGGQSKMLKMLLAFVVALAGTLLFMKVLQRIPMKSPAMVPLIGMMMGSVVSSITGFIAYHFDLAQNISSWLQGSFSLIVKGRYELLYLGIPILILAYVYAGKFTIAGMGEDFSTNLGLNHKTVVMTGLIIVSFITTLVVITIGSLPFVGLIVPNIVALYKGDHLKHTLLDTVLVGTIFVLVCDILGRVILAPYEVSISVIISVLGSLIFLLLLVYRRRTL